MFGVGHREKTSQISLGHKTFSLIVIVIVNLIPLMAVSGNKGVVEAVALATGQQQSVGLRLKY